MTDSGFNLLADSVIRIRRADRTVEHLSLPKVYAALHADAVASFPALRSHQRHAWHAFLCQLGALACIRSGRETPLDDADGWRAALRTLTPDFPDDTPWTLITALDRPAFLQTPAPGGLNGFKRLQTPDELDMLVTAKNHDVKGARLAEAQPEDWLFALLTLQTMEGFLGAGNYGISRMNGGFANRPGFSVAPPGGIGAHVMRDLGRLIAMREQVLDSFKDFEEDGLALVWLEPWDGTASLSPRRLDPYYIEICRRVRLVEQEGRVAAMTAGSKVARIAFGKEARGLTGDPWTPVDGKSGEAKALTVDRRGFFYKRLSDILFEQGFSQAALQKIGKDDPQDVPYVLICRALARGQGKTEGLHERRILIPPKAAGYWRSGGLEPLAQFSEARIEQAGRVRTSLRYALMMLFQNGPDSKKDEFKPRDPSSAARAEPFLETFEQEVDGDFFEQLFREVEAEDDPARVAVRATWLAELRHRARVILAQAEAGSPVSAVRQYRARVRAESAFDGSFNKAFSDYFFKD